MVTAIILAGGLGTRLAEAVPHLPKALAPIQGVPFLQLLLHQLEMSGIASKVILALGYKASPIQSFLQHRSYAFQLDFSIESTPLGTGGALLHALPQADSKTLLVLNGDSYFDLSLSAFLHFHCAQNGDLSIACQQVENTSRYGAIEIDPFHRITRFCEKSGSQQPGWINAGIYLMQKELLNSFACGSYSLEKDFFPLFLQKNIFAYCHEGAFIDIGTPSSYREAQEILKPWITR